MIEPPFLTVITVTRNNRAGLARTARSLKMQDRQKIEWIIVDGASTDGTAVDLETYCARIYSEPDQGPYDAMNKGLAVANGQYVMFLNAGDCFASPSVIAQIAAAAKSAPDFIYGDALELTGGTPRAKPAKHWRRKAFGMFTHHQAMIYRSQLAKDFRYASRYKIAADYEFTLKFLNRAKGCVYLPAAICIFEAGGLSQINARCGRLEQYAIRRDLRIVRPIKNALIFAYHIAAWQFRKRAPMLFWSIRSLVKQR